MPSQRELDLIIKLRQSAQNDPELKKLQGQIDQLHKTSEKSSKQLASGLTASAKAANSLKREIDGVSKSLGGLGYEATRSQINLKGMGQKTMEVYARLIAQTKHTKDMVGQLARSLLDSAEASKKANSSSNEYQNTLAKVKNTTESLIDVRKRFVSTLKEVLQAQQLLIDSTYSFQVAEQKTISVTNRLEAELRKIQVLGRLKGVSIFEQNVQSTKTFISELEKLRIKLAEVTGEKFAARTSVTKQMIFDFRKISEEIEKARVSSEKLQSSFDELRRTRNTFLEIQNGLEGTWIKTKKAGEAVEGVNIKLQDLARGHIKLSETSQKTIGSLISDYERLKGELKETLGTMDSEFKKGTNSFQQLEIATTRILRKIRQDLSSNGVSVKELSQLYTQAIDMMIENLNRFSQTSFKTWASNKKDMVGTATILEESNQKILKLKSSFETFSAAVNLSKSGIVSLRTAQEAANKVVERANVVIESLGVKFHKNAVFAREAALSFMTVGSITRLLRESLSELSTSLEIVAQKERVLAAASKYLTNSKELLRREVALAAQRSELLERKIIELTEKLLILSKRTNVSSVEVQKLTVRLEFLGIQAKNASTHFSALNNRLMQVEQRAGDSSRALSRMSSQGFANMIISQAAWMAGFQVIFGTLDRFKKALDAVLETQLAVARAMRTIRSETHTSAQMYEMLTDAVDEMRMSVGASATETGEALYQLGSAGLNLQESLAALAPTIDTVIGAEADMEQITNLVAGLYNNFADQIVKVDGKIQTISATFDKYNEKVIESTTLTEKFQHINDLLIRTFDAHQAEMVQIKDGLKFMAQSAKAANLSLTQQLGILATLHDHLIKAGAAGRGMRVIISRISKEAEKFAKAFDIEIDLTKPLDFMEILEKLNKKIKDQILTVEELGVIFKRLGLRGAEPLLILIKHFDELNKNIGDLTNESLGAAEAMRKVRLDNLGDQAEIAYGKIEVLLKRGLAPLAEFAKSLIQVFNFIGNTFKEVNDVLGGFLGTLVKVGGSVGVLVVVAVFLKNLGGIAKWLQGMFLHLAASMKNFGTSVFETDKQAKTLGASLVGLTNASRGYLTVLGALTKEEYANARSKQGLSMATATLKASIAGLSAAWVLMNDILKMALWVGVFIAIEKAIVYALEYEKRTLELVKNLKSQAATQKEGVSSLEELRDKMIEATGVSGEWTNELRSLASQLGINVKDYRTASEALDEMKIKMDEIIKKQKEYADATKIEYVRKEFERLEDAIYRNSLALYAGGNAAGLFENNLDSLREKIDDANIKLKAANTTLTFLGNNNAPAGLEKAFADLKEETLRQVSVLTSSIDVWNKLRIELGGVALATENHNQKVNNLIKTLRESLSVGKEKEENLKKLEKLEANLSRELEKTNAEILKWTQSLKESEAAFESNQVTLSNYQEKLSSIKDSLSKAGFNFESLAQAIAKADDEFKNLLQKNEIDNFVNKLTRVRTELSRLENNFDNLNKKVKGEAFLKVLKDLQDLQTAGFKILDQLYEKLKKIGEALADLEKRKISIEVDKTNRNLTESQRIVDATKEKLDKLRDSGVKSGWDLENASRKYRNALKDQERGQKDVVTKSQEQINKSDEIIRAQEKIASSETSSSEERRRALEKVDTELGKQKEQYEKILQANEKTNQARKKLLEEEFKAGRMSESEFNRRMTAQDSRYEASRKVIMDIMDKIADKRTKTLETLGPLYEKEFGEVKERIGEILTKIQEIQTAAARGINLNSASIDAAIIKANELHDNLQRTAIKIVKIKEVRESSGSENDKYWGGVIKRAGGGTVPARVTAGEGFIPPSIAMQNLNLLNTLNGGRSVPRIPSSIASFQGPGGVDKINTYLPVGSYVLSKRGMEAYERSARQGAQTFQEGGEVVDTASPPILTSSTEENIGSFTIIVEKGGTSKEFPITGKISVLKSLREELEEDRLTRLH